MIDGRYVDVLVSFVQRWRDWARVHRFTDSKLTDSKLTDSILTDSILTDS